MTSKGVLICLVSCVFATSFRGILVQRQASYEATGPLSEIQEGLDRLTEELNAEHHQHSKLFNRQRTTCSQEYSSRLTNYKSARQVSAQTQEKLKALESSLEVLTKSHKRSSQVLETLTQQTKLLSEAMQNEQTMLQSLESQKQETIFLSEECINIVHSMQDSPSKFLELEQKVVNLVEVANITQVQPVINSFLDLANSDNQDNGYIVQLLQSLKVSTQDSETLKLTQRSHKTLRNLLSSLEYYTKQFSSLENSQKNQVNQVDSEIQQETSKHIQASSLESKNKKLLEDIQNICNDWEKQFKLFGKTRDQEKRIISELEKSANSRGEFYGSAFDKAERYKEEYDRARNTFVYKSQYGLQHKQGPE